MTSPYPTPFMHSYAGNLKKKPNRLLLNVEYVWQCKHSGITKPDFLCVAPACVFFFFFHLKCHYSPTVIWILVSG